MRALLAAVSLLGAGALAGPTAADEVKMTQDGLTLNAELSMAPGKHLADGAVLLIHNWLGYDQMPIIQTLQQLLAAQGLNSLAPTLSLGVDDRHGMYDCREPQVHTLDTADQEIGAWLHWLTEHGATHVVLAGHSGGAMESARFAATHDDPAIAAVVLLAPPTWTPAQEASEYLDSHGMQLSTELAYAQALMASGNDAALLEDVGFLACNHATVSAASFVSYYGDDRAHDTPSILEQISAPVLVIAAGNDRTVKDLPARMQPVADGTRVNLVTIAGADHAFSDRYASQAVDAMTKFLKAATTQ